MASDKNTKSASSTVSAGLAAFNEIKGEEIFTDRPIIRWDDLGASKMPVVGLVVGMEELNLPTGAAARADGRTTWDAFVIALTHDTVNATDDGEVVTIKKGQEVFVAANPKNRSLEQYLGQADMAEIAIIALDKKIDLGRGKNPMTDFAIKFISRVPRTGKFLLSAPPVGQLGQGLQQIETNGAAVPAHAGL